MCIFSCLSARDCLQNLTKKPSRNITNVKFSSLLSKNSQKYLNLKNLKLICRKLNVSSYDFDYYSEIILQNITRRL